MIRCFVAIEIDDAVRKELSSLIEELKPSGRGIRWVRPENLHLTLKFLGEVSEERIPEIEKALNKVAAQLEHFTLRIKGTGTFPEKKRPRVVWAGVESSGQLFQLQKAIEKALSELGFKEEEREFTGHITLGRVKGSPDQLVAKVTVQGLIPGLLRFKEKEFGIINVREFVLMKSELRPDGARYERIGVYMLK
jgi:2'-5' RNA ligase